MSYQSTPRRAHAMNHKRLMVIASLVTALCTALLVIPPWRHMLLEPAAVPEPTQRAGSTTPAPAADEQGNSLTKQQQVCGRWQSNGSQKVYDFVCTGPTSFQIREVDGASQGNAGSGTVTADGQIQGELLIGRNNRTAYLRLNVSSDREKLEGSWSGKAGVESGEVSFHRVQ